MAKGYATASRCASKRPIIRAKGAQRGPGNMPCICKHQLAALSAAARLDLGFHVTPPTALLRLAANLSMAPPALDIPLLDELRNMHIPSLAMGPAQMGTLSSLVNAALTIRATLGIDPLAPN